MKNRIIYLLVLLLCICLCSTCGAKDSKDVSADGSAVAESWDHTEESRPALLAAFSLGEYDNNTAKADDVFYLWSYEQTNPHQDDDAARSATVDFCGETYRGSYQYSKVTEGNLYISDTYSGAGGKFSINRSTGEMDSVFPRTKEAIDNPDPAAYQSLAEETAGQYVPIEEYTLSIEDEGEGIRAFHYFRVIDGVTAWDRIDIVIDGGCITAFTRYMTKEFPEGLNRIGEARLHAFAEAIQSGSAKDAIEKTVAESGRKASFDQEYVRLVLLPDDRIGALYSGKLETEIQTQGTDEPSYISLSAVYLVAEEGAVSPEYESDIYKPEYADQITLIDTFSPYNFRLIEGDAAHLVQDIIRPLPYGDELYDCSTQYYIIVGNTWYGYSSWDGYMNHEDVGLYCLSEEQNEAMKMLLSLSSEYDEGKYADAISVVDRESPDHSITIEGDEARIIQSIVLSLPYGEEEYDHTAQYKIVVGDTWFGYEPEERWLDHEGKGEYILPGRFNDRMKYILGEYKR